MSKLPVSLDDLSLRRQLSLLKESVDYLVQQRIDVLLNLSAEKLRILLIVYFLNRAKTKTVSEESHINRSSTTSYLNELYETDKILDRVEEENEKPGIKSTYVFCIVDDVVNNILSNVVEAINSEDEQELNKIGTDSPEIANHDAQDNSAVQGQIYQYISGLPPIGQKIFDSLKNYPGQSVKKIAQRIGCDPTTANKYKLFVESITAAIDRPNNDLLRFLSGKSPQALPYKNRNLLQDPMVEVEGYGGYIKPIPIQWARNKCRNDR